MNTMLCHIKARVPSRAPGVEECTLEMVQKVKKVLVKNDKQQRSKFSISPI